MFSSGSIAVYLFSETMLVWHIVTTYGGCIFEAVEELFLAIRAFCVRYTSFSLCFCFFISNWFLSWLWLVCKLYKLLRQGYPRVLYGCGANCPGVVWDNGCCCTEGVGIKNFKLPRFWSVISLQLHSMCNISLSTRELETGFYFDGAYFVCSPSITTQRPHRKVLE